MTTTVVRIRRTGGIIVQDCDEYIGRRMTMGGWNLPSSIWANPYKIGKDGDRLEVLTKYYNHIRSRKDLYERLPELRGKVLGCWCGQKEGEFYCHGDVLVYMLQCLDNGTADWINR